MRNHLVLLMSIVASTLLPICQSGSSHGSAPLALTHTTVIDLNGAPAAADMTVIVTGERITALGKAGQVRVPEGARVVDATGKFLIPGLWDMHTHTTFYETREVEEVYFPSFIANGITGIREMGSIHSAERFNRWRARTVEGRLVAPRIILGRMIGAPGDSSLAISVRDEREARAAVQRVKREGYDFVKVYSGLSREAYLALVDEAKRQGIPFAGHVPSVMNAGEASDAGQKSIEHMGELITSSSTQEESMRREDLGLIRRNAVLKSRDPEFEKEKARFGHRLLDSYSDEKAERLFARFARNGTWLCPTLVANRALAMLHDPAFGDDPRFRYVSARRRQKDRRYWEEARSRPPEQSALLSRVYKLKLRQVGAAHRAGVGLLAGTDTNSVSSSYPFAGFSLHDELALFVEAGLTPMEALRTATYEPAKYLGLLDSLGTVEQGKIADLVLLEANPLEDINNTRRIHAVVADGRFFSKEALQKMLSDVEAAARKR